MQRDDIAKKIRQLFESDGEIAALYLFGSVATGKAHPQSDIDVAILFEKRLARWESYQRREKYFALLAKELRTEPDVVDMEEVNLILLFEILKDGRLVVENNHEKSVDFGARKIIECLDFQFIVKRCAEGMRRKSVEKIRGQDRRTIQENIITDGGISQSCYTSI